jgi:ferritin
MIEKLIAYIREQQLAIAVGLCTHPAEDYAKYRQAVGSFKAFQDTLDTINNLLEERERN